MKPLFLMLLTIATLCRAETPLEIQLVSEVTSITPGKPFYVGLALHHGEGYHTYWKHPGIVGVPTGIKWNALPKGFTADAIDWPEPEPVLMFQIKAQGYERDVVLPIKITPPANLKPGTSITLSGKSLWMACARQCNPGFKDLSITLPVSASSEPVFDKKWHPKFETERSIRPQASDNWQASVVSRNKHHTLTLTPGANARPFTKAEAAKLIFFTEDGIIDSDKPQKIELRENGDVVIELIEADYILGDRPKNLSGVLLRKESWEKTAAWRCLRVSLALR